MWTWCAHITSLVDRGARPFEQGSGNGPQRNQAARGGVGEPPGWLRTWHWQTMNACFVRVTSAFLYFRRASLDRTLPLVSSRLLKTVARCSGAQRSLSPFRAHYLIVYPAISPSTSSLSCYGNTWPPFLGMLRPFPERHITVVLVVYSRLVFSVCSVFTTTNSLHSLIAAFYFLSLPMDICGFFVNLIRVTRGYSGFIPL